mmetsp:Transcript_116719/g.337130  ORF Transcript_116719/g.337130 Transcript_116719/m.337130 type:complete len:688 (+) Transcript_116719:282-2345(+)
MILPALGFVSSRQAFAPPDSPAKGTVLRSIGPCGSEDDTGELLAGALLKDCSKNDVLSLSEFSGEKVAESMTFRYTSAIEGMTDDHLPDIWPELSAEAKPNKLNLKRSRARGALFRLQPSAQMSGDSLTTGAGWGRFFVIHPSSNKRLLWDLVSMVMVAYDVVSIPVDVSGLFQGPSDGLANFLEYMDWVTAVFWSFDLPISFITGFHNAGLIEMRLQKIAKHYIQSWLAFDLVIVLVDWIFLIVGANAILRLGKTQRASRIFRTFRLARSLKLHGKLTQFLQGVRSDAVRITANVCLMAASILIFNHYFACGFFFIGSIGEAGKNWIFYHADGESNLFKYVIALHWSLTQFTPAAMEVHPRNFTERVYTVITLFFAMVTFSTFISSITTGMTNLRKLRSDKARQQKMLQDYFAENQVSAELGRRVWEYLSNKHFAHKKHLAKKDIDIFKLLPQSMMSKLNEELYGPILQRNPFFLQYGAVQYGALMQITDATISELSLVSGEEVFIAGKPAAKMYFLMSGHMEYDHGDIRCCAKLKKGDWVSEPALFMKWEHCGTLYAASTAELVEVGLAPFRAIVAAHTYSFHFVKAYIKAFREIMLNDATWDVWRTDVWLDKTLLNSVARTAHMETFPDDRTSAVITVDSGDKSRPSFASWAFHDLFGHDHSLTKWGKLRKRLESSLPPCLRKS